MQIKDEIDTSIDFVKKYNSDTFVNHQAFDLVEMSHNMNSWKLTNKLSERFDKKSSVISKELIKKDGNIYTTVQAW
jgi:hypothetical protein